MKVAQVKGAIILEATRADMNVFEYTPQEIKTAVTGYGSAPKKQVMQMITQLVDIREDAKHDDEYDAIAVGITCLAHEA
jgi:crossover junction endodeoxyribonuclease RuvC